jgi:hypothetical protein
MSDLVRGLRFIPSSDNCCHLGIEMNSRFKATERTTNACRKGRNGINGKTMRVSQIIENIFSAKITVF